MPAPLNAPDDIQATDPASSTGTLAWAGQALTQLYAVTRIRAYLRGAVALGDWIQSQCRDGRGAGGYAGGDDRGRGKDRMEVDRAQHRRVRVLPAAGPGDRRPGLVAAGRPGPGGSSCRCGTRPQGRFDLGTTDDGVTRNDPAQVEDVNSWSYLALRDPAYAASVGWDVSTWACPRVGSAGVSYCTGGRTGRLVRGHRTGRGRLAAAGSARGLRRGPGPTWPTSATPRSRARTRTAWASWPPPTTCCLTARAATCTPRCTPGRPPGTSWPPGVRPAVRDVPSRPSGAEPGCGPASVPSVRRP